MSHLPKGIALLFDAPAELPASFNNVKDYYVSLEVARRGIPVVWIQIGEKDSVSRKGSIILVTLQIPKLRFVAPFVSAIRILIYCLRNGVNLVYVDEWMYFRHSPFRRLMTQIILRRFGIKFVIDQRDPYVDFEVARGKLRPHAMRHKILTLQEKITLYLSNLTILPSEAYARLLVSEGIPAIKVAGFFRGIDTNKFNPGVDGQSIRRNLGLEGRFVVGWFGLMYRHLLIREVLVPLVRAIQSIIPDGYLVIGGEGPFKNAISQLQKETIGLPFKYVGLVPYQELPRYLAACDILLCPVSLEFRFSQHSNWLKIPEALAVGRPIIATKTAIVETDFRNLKGVLWTGPDLSDFATALRSAREQRLHLQAVAQEQAHNMKEFSIASTMPKILDRVIEAFG
jgi:glycosyltransferase involved in cell wall biosynthesis